MHVACTGLLHDAHPRERAGRFVKFDGAAKSPDAEIRHWGFTGLQRVQRQADERVLCESVKVEL